MNLFVKIPTSYVKVGMGIATKVTLLVGTLVEVVRLGSFGLRCEVEVPSRCVNPNCSFGVWVIREHSKNGFVMLRKASSGL